MPGLPDAADAPMPPDAGLDADAARPDAPMPPDAGLDADALAARRADAARRDAAPADAPGEAGPGTRWSPRMVLRAVLRDAATTPRDGRRSASIPP
jgi:hypothetical protein